MYRLQIQERAVRDLASIDKNIARRIVSRLNWLAKNASAVKRESLTGDLLIIINSGWGTIEFCIRYLMTDKRLLSIV